MGVSYGVACKTCKVTRDLDKFYASDCHEVKTAKQAKRYARKIKDAAFSAGLLVSFMADHMGHECVMFKEGGGVERDLDPIFNSEYKDDTDFWSGE